jgi:hypothetical protein
MNEIITIIYDECQPEKQCRVRWPSDQEWIEWASGQRFRQRRGRYIGTERRSSALFRKIRVDQAGVRFTDREINAVILMLQRSETVNLEREGEELRITFKTFRGISEHVLRLPTVHELTVHYAAAGSRTQSIWRIDSLGPTAKLYDVLHIRHVGYAGDVPIMDKVGVIADVIQQIMTDSVDLRRGASNERQ